MTAICCKCGPTKTYKRHNKTDGVMCISRRRKGNRKAQSESRRRKVYGMEPADWDRLLIDQQGRCAICSDPLVSPAVDHCHASGAVRGLLCRHCNVMLGLAKDDPSRLIAGAKYLTQHSAPAR